MKVFILLFVFTITHFSYAREKHVQMSARIYYADHQEQLAITLKNDEGWHTYWKNPGDAGLPVSFEIKVNNEPYQVSESEWPIPKRYIEAGNILAYGYSGTYTFFMPLIADDIQSFNNSQLEIRGKWLVCKDICIPGEQTIIIKFNDQGSEVANNSSFSVTDEDLYKRMIALPKSKPTPNNLEIYLTKLDQANKLRLHYSLKDIELEKFDTHQNLLTPFLTPPFGLRQEKLFYDQNTKTLYGYMDVDWDGEYTDPIETLPSNGQFAPPKNIKFLLQTGAETIVTNFTIENFSPETESLKNFYQTLAKVDDNNKKISGDTNFALYLFFAFLGGLILNLMPCVLPVISLKLFGLLNMREESGANILKHNLYYTLGVLLTFIALGVTVVLLKASGESIGWGFQLQSPTFVFIMMVVLLIMSLNFFGLFEFKTPGGSKLGSVDVSKSKWGDLGAGIIATILSTPCSAPFLGTALTFAFTTSTLNIFVMFTMIGLGLSFPFILTGFFPKLISFLPKPGAWMEKLKYILGFTLLLTFVWLYDVLQNLINIETFGLYINTIFITIFFAFYFRSKITMHKVWVAIVFLIPLLLFTQLLKLKGLESFFPKVNESKIKSHGNLDWEQWSEEKVASIDTQPVFIDFTAKWCLTCKVNKKLVIDTDDFEQLVKENNIKLMIADWTQRDDHITKFLEKNNKVGVPAYFLKVNGKLIDLGEVLSMEKLNKAIKN